MAVRPHQNDVQSRNHRHFVCLSLYNSASLPICRSICRSIQFQQATEILAKLKSGKSEGAVSKIAQQQQPLVVVLVEFKRRCKSFPTKQPSFIERLSSFSHFPPHNTSTT